MWRTGETVPTRDAVIRLVERGEPNAVQKLPERRGAYPFDPRDIEGLHQKVPTRPEAGQHLEESA